MNENVRGIKASLSNQFDSGACARVAGACMTFALMAALCAVPVLEPALGPVSIDGPSAVAMAALAVAGPAAIAIGHMSDGSRGEHEPRARMKATRVEAPREAA